MMKRTSAVIASLSLLVLATCGGNVEAESSGGSTSTSSGTISSSSTSSSHQRTLSRLALGST
jgi:ABC-type glycerol-3-phosphate transport system substrate-binding protein